MSSDEADQEEVEKAMEWLESSDLESPETDSPQDCLEHIRIDHDGHPDQIALHDPNDSSDAWMTAHGDAFVDLGEVR